MILEDDNPLNRIRKATRKKLDEIQESEIIQEMTNAIGDRRTRDLVDLMAKVEISKGWDTVVEYLNKCGHNKYPVPLGYEAFEIKMEPLKYREAIFDIFGCTGWEPVNKDTDKLLVETYSASSSINATKIFTNEVVALVKDQIERSDALFFNPSDFNNNMPDSIVKAMVELQIKEINDIKVVTEDDSVSVAPLWSTDYGRRALSNLGVNGDVITTNEYHMVLSVLHVSSTTKEKLEPIEGKISNTRTPSKLPSNRLYNHLLKSIITHDTESLGNLGSRHSFSVLNYVLRNAIDQYKSNNNSESYRNLLSSIRDHVAVRYPESILPLNEAASESDPRLATPAIMAIGNFYDESAVTALVNIICTKKFPEIRKTCLSSIDNLRQRCPETQVVIKNTLSLDCKNAAELRQYYRKIWEK